LIADDVGLGKTVEAGLIVREMLLRRRVEVIVVAAPASMLLQWQDELAQKFGLDFTIVDREHLLETRRTRGFSSNPWSIGSRFLVSHSVLADEAYIRMIGLLMASCAGSGGGSGRNQFATKSSARSDVPTQTMYPTMGITISRRCDESKRRNS
jgi:hypothetical protein